MGIAFAAVLKRARFRGQPVPFVMELPNYRLPAAKSVARLVWDKAKGFVKKAFTVVLAACVVIWFLQTFDARLNVVDDVERQPARGHRRADRPAVRAAGLRRLARGHGPLMTGFMAKESVVSTLTQVTGEGADLTTLFTPVTAVGVSGVRAAVHAVRGGHRHRAQRAGRRARGARDGAFAVRHRLGGRRWRCCCWRARWSTGSIASAFSLPGLVAAVVIAAAIGAVPHATAHRRRAEGGLQNLPRQLQELQRLLPLGQGS